MRVFRKVFPCHYAADDSGGSGTSRTLLNESATSRKVLSREDMKKIEDYCKFLENARENLNITRTLARKNTETDYTQINKTTADLASALKEIAAQNPEANVFKIWADDFFGIRVARAGHNTPFALLDIRMTEQPWGGCYTVTKRPLTHNEKVIDGPINKVIEALKDIMTDIINYER